MLKVYRKSWIVYIPYLVAIFVFIMFMFLIPKELSLLYIPIGIVLFFFLIRIIKIRRFKIVLDDKGIWVHEGLFPWDKKSVFRSWSNAYSARLNQDLLSWITCSYRVYIGIHPHDATATEIGHSISHIYQGKKLVNEINKTIGERENYSNEWRKSHQY